MEEAKQKKKINYMVYLVAMFHTEAKRNEFISKCIIKFGLKYASACELFEIEPSALKEQLLYRNQSDELGSAAVDMLNKPANKSNDSVAKFQQFFIDFVWAIYKRDNEKILELLNYVSNKELLNKVVEYKGKMYPLDDEKVRNVLSYRNNYSYSFEKLGDILQADSSRLKNNLYKYLDKMIKDNPEDESLVELRDDSYALDEFFKYYGVKNRPRLNR